MTPKDDLGAFWDSCCFSQEGREELKFFLHIHSLEAMFEIFEKASSRFRPPSRMPGLFRISPAPSEVFKVFLRIQF